MSAIVIDGITAITTHDAFATIFLCEFHATRLYDRTSFYQCDRVLDFANTCDVDGCSCETWRSYFYSIKIAFLVPLDD